MHAQEMIRTHPHVQGNTNDALIRCIEECYACAQACTACTDACLGEQMVQQLARCIRLNLDCADVCAATGSVATRRTGSDEQVIRSMLDACALACRICGEDCERHAKQHCAASAPRPAAAASRPARRRSAASAPEPHPPRVALIRAWGGERATRGFPEPQVLSDERVAPAGPGRTSGAGQPGTGIVGSAS